MGIRGSTRCLMCSSPDLLCLIVHLRVDQAGTYLLRVHWLSVADHRDGFRQPD